MNPKIAENAGWIQPGGPEVPLSGIYRGGVQIAVCFLLLNSTFEFTKFDINEYIAKENEVVVIGSYQARIKATERLTAQTLSPSLQSMAERSSDTRHATTLLQ